MSVHCLTVLTSNLPSLCISDQMKNNGDVCEYFSKKVFHKVYFQFRIQSFVYFFTLAFSIEIGLFIYTSP